MIEVYLTFISLVAFILWATKPTSLRWSCLVGRHDYTFLSVKHGMYIDDQGEIQGSGRNIYRCRYCTKLDK